MFSFYAPLPAKPVAFLEAARISRISYTASGNLSALPRAVHSRRRCYGSCRRRCRVTYRWRCREPEKTAHRVSETHVRRQIRKYSYSNTVNSAKYCQILQILSNTAVETGLKYGVNYLL